MVICSTALAPKLSGGGEGRGEPTQNTPFLCGGALGIEDNEARLGPGGARDATKLPRWKLNLTPCPGPSSPIVQGGGWDRVTRDAGSRSIPRHGSCQNLV